MELGEGGEVENGVGEVEVFKDEAGNMVVVVVVEDIPCAARSISNSQH